MAKKRLTYTEVEAHVSRKLPQSLRGNDVLADNNPITWAGMSYSDHITPQLEQREQKANNGPTEKTVLPKWKPARLKKKRTASDESKSTVSGSLTLAPSLPPVPTIRVFENDGRPLSAPTFPSSSTSQRQDIIDSNNRIRSWMERSKSYESSRSIPSLSPIPSTHAPTSAPSTVRSTLGYAPTPSASSTLHPSYEPSRPTSSSYQSMYEPPVYEPPPPTSSNFRPGHAHYLSTSSTIRSGLSQPLSASSTIRSRPKTPGTICTRIDEQEYLDMADFVYVTPASPPIVAPIPVQGHSRYFSAGYSVQGGSGLPPAVSPDILGAASTLVDTDTEGYDPRYSSRHRRRSTSQPGMEEEEEEEEEGYAGSIDTARAGKNRRQSNDTLDGWVEYLPESQSLRTIKDARDDSPSPEPRGGALSSGCSTPTAVAGLRTPESTPMTPTTLVAGSRFSAFSQNTWRSQKSQQKQQPTPAATTTTTTTTKPRSRQKSTRSNGQKRKARSRRNSRVISPAPSKTFSFLAIDSTTGKARNPSHSSKSSVFESALYDLDYDYGLAVDVLIYGIPTSISEESKAPDIFEVRVEQPDDVFDPYNPPLMRSEAPTPTSRSRRASRIASKALNPSSEINRSRSSSRRNSRVIGLPASSSARGKRTSPRTSVILETKAKQRRSFFSQVSHLFLKAS